MNQTHTAHLEGPGALRALMPISTERAPQPIYHETITDDATHIALVYEHVATERSNHYYRFSKLLIGSSEIANYKRKERYANE